MSSQPRPDRGQRERSAAGRRDQHRDQHREQHRDDRRASPDSSSSRPPYYAREVDPPPTHVQDVPRVKHSDSSCMNICSRRGIVLICAILTNALVLICVISAHIVTSGMSSVSSMGGFSINSNFNLQGTELQQVRDLDMQYSQMRAPAMYGGIPFSLTFGVLSLLFVVAGSKPPQLTARKLLVGALVFQAVGSVGYVVAVGLYLHFIIQVNSTKVCQQREILYSRNGYTWMSCDVSGADAAVALFGLITAILYVAGTVLTFQTIRRVKAYLKERKRREAERQQARGNHHRDPLRADTSAV